MKKSPIKHKFILPTVLLSILVIIFIGELSWYLWTKQASTHNTSPQKIVPSSPSPQTSLSGFPIPKDHPNVNNIVLYYTFKGAVQTVDANGISLKSDSTPLPSFGFTPTSQVDHAVNGQGQNTQPAKREDIKPGAMVFLTVSYNEFTKKWSIVRVTVLDNQATTR